MKSRLAAARRWGLPLVVSGVLLWAALRSISGMDVAAALERTEWLALGVAAAILSCSYAIRSWRWTVPLPAPVGLASSIGAIGIAANHFLPARGGELLRSWLLRRAAGVAMTESLAVVLGERIADAIVLVGLAALAMLGMPALPEWWARGAMIAAVLSGAGAVCFVAAPWIHAKLEGPYAGIAERLRPAVAGIVAVRRLATLVRFVPATAAIWMIDASAGHWIARGMGIAIDYPAQLLLLAGLAFSGVLPAVPGNIGVYQFVAIQTLSPFGVDASRAVAFLLVFQTIDYAVAAGGGLAGYLWLPEEVRDIKMWRAQAGRAEVRPNS